MARPARLLLLLPPLIFLFFGALAYVGLRRENPQELPMLVGRPAAGAGGDGGAARRSGADRRRPAGAWGEARELLGELVRAVPGRAPAADSAGGGGDPGDRGQLQGRAGERARVSRRARRSLRADRGGPEGRTGLDWGIVGCRRPSSSGRTGRSSSASPGRSAPASSRSASGRRWQRAEAVVCSTRASCGMVCAVPNPASAREEGSGDRGGREAAARGAVGRCPGSGPGAGRCRPRASFGGVV